MIKETIGPYTRAESRLNPLNIIEKAGKYMFSKTKLVMLSRNYNTTLDSWKRNWGDKLTEEELLENYELSLETMKEIEAKAEQEGIPITHYDYQANKNPEVSAQKLFKELELEYEPVIKGWDKEPYKGRIKENLIIPNEPKIFLPKGIHSKTETSAGLRYYN